MAQVLVPTPAITRRIVKLVESGASLADASMAAGLPARTTARWMARGERSLDGAECRKGDALYLAFYDVVRQAHLWAVVKALCEIRGLKYRRGVEPTNWLQLFGATTCKPPRPPEANGSAGKPPRTRPQKARKRQS